VAQANTMQAAKWAVQKQQPAAVVAHAAKIMPEIQPDLQQWYDLTKGGHAEILSLIRILAGKFVAESKVKKMFKAINVPYGPTPLTMPQVVQVVQAGIEKEDTVIDMKDAIQCHIRKLRETGGHVLASEIVTRKVERKCEERRHERTEDASDNPSILNSSPLYGVKQAYCASLVEAMQAVDEELDGPHAAEQAIAGVKSNFHGKMPHGLTVDEAAAIRLYTMEAIYRDVNAALRSADRTKVTPWFKYLNMLFRAVEKCPKATGATVFRGIGCNVDNLAPQGVYNQPKDTRFTWWDIVSTTTMLEVAGNFSGSHEATIFIVLDIKSGIDAASFSAFPTEAEVVLPPGTQLELMSKFKIGSTTIIQLREADVPFGAMIQ